MGNATTLDLPPSELAPNVHFVHMSLLDVVDRIELALRSAGVPVPGKRRTLLT